MDRHAYHRTSQQLRAVTLPCMKPDCFKGACSPVKLDVGSLRSLLCNTAGLQSRAATLPCMKPGCSRAVCFPVKFDVGSPRFVLCNTAGPQTRPQTVQIGPSRVPPPTMQQERLLGGCSTRLCSLESNTARRIGQHKESRRLTLISHGLDWQLGFAFRQMLYYLRR